MRVLIVSPTYFDPGSVIGGGERYPTELARSLAPHVGTTLVSFSSQRISQQLGPLRLEVFPARALLGGSRNNPFSLEFLRLLHDRDVINNHQVFTMVSDLSCLAGATFGKRFFVTDHGGGAARVLNQRLPVFDLYHASICQSHFGVALQPAPLQSKTIVIRGGFNRSAFTPDPSVPRRNHLLFVGRLLPHKGVDYLIRAFRLWNRPDWRLRIVGRPHLESYHQELRRLAGGLPVDFVQNANDNELLHEYRSSKISILPSVHNDSLENHTRVPELMGLTLLEAQSCGTPVVCTDVGGMPEFVRDGVTGRIVRQNSPESLAEAFDQLTEASRWASCSEAAPDFTSQFSMESVALRHLEAYQVG